MRTCRIATLSIAWLALAGAAPAADVVPLTDPDKKTLGWSFDNGREFPGATGALTVAEHDGSEVLRLAGDFTKGGAYVQAGRSLPNVPVTTLTLRIKDPDSDVLKFRIIDSTGQCHQIVYRIGKADRWRKVSFPLRLFFERMGKPDAVKNVVRYQKWGGRNDGKWHGPAKGLYILVSAVGETKKRVVMLGDLAAVAAEPKPAAGAETIVKWMPVDPPGEEGAAWKLSLGREYPGAKGSLEVVEDAKLDGNPAMELAGDFSGGGAYVEAQRPLRWLEADDIRRVRFKVRSANLKRISFRLGDATGQTHQKRGGVPITPDDKWHEITLEVAKVAGTESWGGANDGAWHGPAKYLTIIVPGKAGVDTKKPSLRIADVAVEGVLAARVQPASFHEGFEDAAKLPDGWQATGEAGTDVDKPFAGLRALRLSRSEEKVTSPAAVTGPAFDVGGGAWKLGGAFRSELVSPDNSYNATVRLDCYSAGGGRVARLALAEVYGRTNWRPMSKTVELPREAATARFHIELRKAHGRFWADELSASYVAPKARPERIDRALLTTARTGNLLFPGDETDVSLTIVARRPLEPDRREVRYVLCDYWGAEQMPARTAPLEPGKRTGDGEPTYAATLDLADAPIEVGRYYEVHVEVPRADGAGEPFADFTSLAVLPEAEAKKHDWRKVPFTCRNWDNRIREYFILGDRLGLRVLGIWSGWKPEPPYKTHAPGFEYIRKFDAGAVMRGQGNTIEYRRKGWEKYDDQALREGAARLVREYNKEGRVILCLGNEPHGKGEKVLEDVAAYRAMYEGAKREDPNVFVLGTSVGAAEEYFAAGMSKYCDAVDFHTYNTVEGIRRTFATYRELFAKYPPARPIWSTELGLNSQGMTRLVVANDLIRKFATFFACGGENASWFGLLYPDPKGTAAGSAGQAHNVFFSRYRCYSPKLDAIAYYNMVNGICVKRFVGERLVDGVRAMLFRDDAGRALQVLWSEGEPRDVFLPLSGVEGVKLVRIDGGIGRLDAAGKGLTLRVSGEPVLLLYEGGPAGPVEAFAPPAASLIAAPEAMVKGGTAEIAVGVPGGRAPTPKVVAPFGWTVRPIDAPTGQARFRITAPAETDAREAAFRVDLTGGGSVVGELGFRTVVRGVLSARLLPGVADDGSPTVRLIVHNNAPDAREVTWRLSLPKAVAAREGKFNPAAAKAPQAYFAEAAEGTVAVGGRGEKAVEVPLADVDDQTVYTVAATVVDPDGRVTSLERLMAGFVPVAKVAGKLAIDGKLDEKAWSRARVCELHEARQMRFLRQDEPWTGPEDLSGKLRFLWDDEHLYVAMEVTDDVLARGKKDGMLWAQDGLQFLVDPGRGSEAQPGKYDYSAGVGTAGPQVWCHLVPPGRPTGEAKDILLAGRPTGREGDIVYEMAIPWSRVAPFAPGPGANLGMCMVLNEDDGKGRFGFLGWFGDVQSKQIDAVGDLILRK